MCWDRADGDGWAGVFTPDGVFEVAPVGKREPYIARGHAALAAFCVEFNREIVGVHLPAMPFIDVDGDRATGHVNFHFVGVGRHAPAHTTRRTAIGHYEVEYHRVDGTWLMAHRLEKATISERADLFDY